MHLISFNQKKNISICKEKSRNIFIYSNFSLYVNRNLINEYIVMMRRTEPGVNIEISLSEKEVKLSQKYNIWRHKRLYCGKIAGGESKY